MLIVNYIDIILLLPLLYGAYRGFSKGFIVELATLVGLALGVFVAVRYSYLVEGFLKDFLDVSATYISYIALSATFLIVVVLIYLLGKLITKIAEAIALGMVNKILGTVMGIMKYFIAVCVILLVVHALDDKFDFIGKETKEKSLLFYPFLNFAERMYNMIRF